MPARGDGVRNLTRAPGLDQFAHPLSRPHPLTPRAMRAKSQAMRAFVYAATRFWRQDR
jgi:hypothetical protein